MTRSRLVFVLAVVMGAALFRLPGLGQPAEEYFDEVYHAKSARQYIDGAAPAEWVHPPMAKHLISLGVRAFGYEPWAWRLAPALFGVALAPLFYLLSLRVAGRERAARFATVILLLDGVYLVQSRIAMTNIFAVFFQVLAVWLLLGAVLEARLPPLRTLLAGSAFGLALSTRWTSLFVVGLLGLVTLGVRRRRLLCLRELALLGAAFVLVPALIYILSYLPLVYLRPGLMPWDGSLLLLLDLQKEVWNYHAHLDASHPYYSPWYSWPFMVRPTWYYFTQTGEMLRGIIAIGNPAVWWASVPVTLWAIVTGVEWPDPRSIVRQTRERQGQSLASSRQEWWWRSSLRTCSALVEGLGCRDSRRLFAAAGFLLLYLPWGLSPRTLNFSHYLFEAIPYACLALGLFLDEHWDGAGRGVVQTWLGIAAILFLLFVPLLTGLSIPVRWFHSGVWTWFPSWI